MGIVVGLDVVGIDVGTSVFFSGCLVGGFDG